MVSEKTGSFDGQAKAYFDWCWQDPPPEIWTACEKPALTEEILEAKRIMNTLHGVNKPKFLDVGVGAGKVIGLLTELGFPITDIMASDISGNMAEMVKNKFPDLKMQVADVATPGFLEDYGYQTFDCITANMLLNHLNNTQLEQALTNFYKLLTDDGFVIATIPNPNNVSDYNRLAKNDDGYWTTDQVAWGGTVKYNYRQLLEYQDYFDFSGFSTGVKVANYKHDSRRAIIVARKSEVAKSNFAKWGMGLHNVRGKYHYSK